MNKYQELVNQSSPNSPILKNVSYAFLFGGALCLLAQWISSFLVERGMTLGYAQTWASIALIALSSILTAFNVYDNIAKVAGAGTLVPITGFANAVVAPAMEFKTEGFIAGTAARMFIIAGPVIVYGVAASFLAGIIHYFFRG